MIFDSGCQNKQIDMYLDQLAAIFTLFFLTAVHVALTLHLNNFTELYPYILLRILQ